VTPQPARRERQRSSASKRGWKHSNFGDLGAYDEDGVRFYTRQKSVMQRWPGSARTGADFSMPVAS
jgi:malonate-semialdehyde dehydrogenase (acetylating)/methylmalonate-semialdehyde dehydrogenase